MMAGSLALLGGSLLSGALAVALLRSQQALRSTRALVAELRESQQREHTALSERSALDALKDEFISTVSHELRTPLTSIRGSLGLLSSGVFGPSNAKAVNLLRIATSNTDRLIRLINDILDLERMQSGRAPLAIRRCSLPELIDIATESLSSITADSNVAIEFIPRLSATGLFFDGDPDRVVQVLTNLLSNAVKFSPAGSTVQILAESNPDSIQLRVVDQGRGIPAEKLESIFDRFLQVEDNDSRQKGGTGLGLAICRTIVEQHGGSIWAERNLAAGSTFHIVLPRAARTSDVVHPTTPVPVGEGSILVCDDDSNIRTVVCEHLQRQGYRCHEAASGKEAISLASQHPIDAILLDLYMPGLSGWETLQHLRSTRATAHIPVVILSVLDPALRGEIAGNAQGWVQKPFHERHLFSELGRVLQNGPTPANILLVEEDDDLGTIFEESLSGTDITVHRVATRQQAIRHCVSSRPDLIVLDLALQDAGGFSLISWLQRQPGLADLPLVVFGGRDIPEGDRTRLRLGPTEFLTKAAVETSDVEAIVRSMVPALRARSAAGSARLPSTQAS